MKNECKGCGLVSEYVCDVEWLVTGKGVQRANMCTQCASRIRSGMESRNSYFRIHGKARPMCKRCEQKCAIENKLYCATCRKIVTAAYRERQRIDDALNVRTLSRRGTEMIGRPARPTCVAAEQEDMDE